MQIRFSFISLFYLSLFALPVLTSADACAAPQQHKTGVGNAQSLALNQQGLDALAKNKPAEAEALLRRAVELDPANSTAIYNLSGVLTFNKKKDEAIALLEKHGVQTRGDAGLLVRYGDLLFSTGKIPEATAQYEKGFELNKNYAGLTSKLGLAYALSNRLDESEQMYLAAAKAEPKNGDVLGNLSSILLSLGKTDQALATAREAVQLAPKKETFITLGSAYEAKKDFKAALNSFKRAQELGANSDEVTQKITALSKLAA